jgi:single-stranded-DNA-specific exonuclease
MYVRLESSKTIDQNAVVTRPIWVAPDAATPGAPRLHDDPLLDAILRRRLDDPAAAADFLDQRPRPAPDPNQLPGMAEAVGRIARALRQGESIGIFGDYDTDGVTSSALLTLALRAASDGAQPVAVRLPRRYEGYGLSNAGVDDLAAAGARLLIAVDCGSKDHAAVAHARDRGLDVVILDHHRITDEPPAGAIFASAQLDECSPLRIVSAAGLAYLLATALAQEGFDTGSGMGEEPVALLDLAMIGLVGDVSALTGVNRPLVRDGLRQLRVQRRAGLRAMCELAGIDLDKVTSGDVAFRISPRLNAPGRLDDPRVAYELLVTSDSREAFRLADQTERANQRRRLLQDQVLRDIEESLAGDPRQLERRVLLFAGQDWEPGIIGLAASKLAERFDRPVIVMTSDEGVAHGSARSVPGFDITTALTGCAELLIRHGGHERAAGLALNEVNLGELDAALQQAIETADVQPPGPPRLEIDADLEPERLRLETARLLQTLGPFGEGNPVPLLRVFSAPLREYLVMGRERQHLKLHIGEARRTVEAILWNGAGRSRELIGARTVDIVGTLETNEWNGNSRVQMRVVDFRRSGS